MCIIFQENHGYGSDLNQYFRNVSSIIFQIHHLKSSSGCHMFDVISLYHHPWYYSMYDIKICLVVWMITQWKFLFEKRHMIPEHFLEPFKIIFLRRKIGKGEYTSLRNDMTVAAGLSVMHTAHIIYIRCVF